MDSVSGLVGPKHVSNSQLSHGCGLALQFARARQPWPFRSIALVYGSSLHAGLETWLCGGHSLESAKNQAHRVLAEELAGTPQVKFDTPIKRGKKAAKILDSHDALVMLDTHLEAWHRLMEGWVGRAIGCELSLFVPLTGMGDWKLNARLDAVVETADEKRIWDFKTSAKAWDDAKLAGAKDQALLYIGAEAYYSGKIADKFSFWVFEKGTENITEHTVAFDVQEINNIIQYKVKPTIRLIEAGAFVGRTDWWGHHPDRCPYWDLCPLGGGTQ